MKCSKCGAELSEDTNFCSYCGHKTEVSPPSAAEETEIPPIPHVEKEEEGKTNPNASRSFADKVKDKGVELWKRLSIYGKVTTVSIAVFVLLCLVALLAGKTAAVVIGIVQIALAVVSILMHKGVIKLEQKKMWLKWLVLVVAILFTVLNVMSYSWGAKITTTNKTSPISNGNSANEAEDIERGNISLPSILPEPQPNSTTQANKTAIVPCGASECLGKDYGLLVDEFKRAGFQKVFAEATANLELENLDQKGQVYEITIDGTAVFDLGDEFEKSVIIRILYHDAKKITVPISSEDAADTELTELIKLFEGAGFVNLTTETEEDIDPEYSQDAFRNDVSIENDDSFTISDTFPIDAEVRIVTHIPYEKYKVTLHINFIPNLLFNKYGVEVSRGYTELGTLSHGEDGDFEMWLCPGKHTFTFTKVRYIKPTKEITIDVKGETEIFYDLSCYKDSIHIEKTAHIDSSPIGEDEAAVPAANSGFKYKNYKDVETQLKEAGFNNISTLVLYDIVFGWTAEGEVDSVKINGKTDYVLGDVFAKDIPIVITYHMLEKDDPSNITMTKASSSFDGMDYLDVKQAFKDLGFTNISLNRTTIESTSYTDGEVFEVEIGGYSFDSGDVFKPDEKVEIKYYIVEKPAPVFYSTNDYETAKKGNTGVFSYRDRGVSYDIYWIIDFDEGYVYFFTDGNGESFCDRLKIDSGTLNDKVTITYHDGGDTWSYKLHFKYVDHPETLIMVDQNGFDLEYSTTDLDDALALRETKTIKDY